MKRLERDQKTQCYKIALSLLSLGIIFHLILFNSIVELYQNTTQIVPNIPVVSRWNVPAPSSRIVIFLVDGLRADQLFSSVKENAGFLAPFMVEKSFRDGTWGLISKSKGSFGDAAPMFTGIQSFKDEKNFISLDSVFNQSSNTWIFGSPRDLLPFTKDKSTIFSFFSERDRETLQNGMDAIGIKLPRRTAVG